MITEQRLILASVTGITHSTRQEQWRERYDLYRHVWHVTLDAAWTMLEVPAPRAKTQLETIINELDGLRSRTNIIPGYVFKPTKHAIRSAKFYIFETYAKMMGAFPRPSFVLDGEGGIIIKWSQDGRTVRLNCLSEVGDQDYLYFENGEYDTEDNVTPISLKNRLDWLTQHERESAR